MVGAVGCYKIYMASQGWVSGSLKPQTLNLGLGGGPRKTKGFLVWAFCGVYRVQALVSDMLGGE